GLQYFTHSCRVGFHTIQGAAEAVDAVGECGDELGNKTHRGRVGQVALVFGDLIHEDGQQPRHVGFPQTFDILEVLRVDLVRQGRGPDDLRVRVGRPAVAQLADLAALEVAAVVGKVGHDAPA